MRWGYMLLGMLTAHATVIVAGCAIGEDAVVPLVPEMVVEETVMRCPGPFLERVELVRIVAEPQPQLTKKRAVERPVVSASPLGLVHDAFRGATVQPGREHYRQGSTETNYIWESGRVYTIFLTPQHGTGISLPPGETLAQSLFLNKEHFEVVVSKVGEEGEAYDMVLIRPMIEKAVQYAFLATKSGRVYHLQFVVGTIGMHLVKFQVP